jgi:hypothetical protein
MRLHPQLFAHIPQPVKTKHTPEEWVVIAERLASEHGGVLPDRQELRRTGYGNLPNTMRLHPDLFAHIPQRVRATRGPEEWVAVAEQLAAEYGDTLPGPQELRKHGHACLVKAMNQNPQLFAHIRQQRRVMRTPQQWAAVAEKLAEEHGGTLPRAGQLQRCGYKSLSRAMYLHPELFSHIKQQRPVQREPREWVPVAERLAEGHGGTLPNPKQLRESGYNSLVHALHRCPQLFAHIKRNRRTRRGLHDLKRKWPDLALHVEPGRKNLKTHEWVRVAERLATTRGALPGAHRLKTSGYRGLWHAKRKHPDLFAHIPRASSA